MQTSATGGVIALGVSSFASQTVLASSPKIISPGCRKSKVKVAKIYMGKPEPHWPKPTLDLNTEKQTYETEFERLKPELADVDFVVDELVTAPEQIKALAEKIQGADGVLVIQFSIWTREILNEILALKKPTVLFALPYSGHEWVGYGALRKQPEGELFDCLLTSDYDQLTVGIRPFRAIHHLHDAKILNITARELDEVYVNGIKEKYGTEIIRLDRERILKTYESMPDKDATEEAKRWISQAERVVEPSEDEIFRSCKLALAFEKLLDEEEATVITADCYGTMYRQLPAFPCIGFTRLNDMGLGGICESDLRSAMTHIIMQGLCGKPGFISDPTMDVSKNSAILAHCLGSTRMDGPNGPRESYKIRTIMERQEGAVTQVRMRIGQKVTQAILVGTDLMHYFTGKIIEAPDVDRGCRTKITVQVDGDAEKLWQNWQHGLHRQTCYGDITEDLKRFCRFKRIELIDETYS
jgi:hypothetical protein